MKSKAFASALVLVALSSSLSAAAEKVTIMYTATAAFASAFVAKDQGFFEQARRRCHPPAEPEHFARRHGGRFRLG